MQGQGTTAVYGSSPAIHFHKCPENKESREHCILLVGALDVRHVLETLAYSNEKLKFYIIEEQTPTIARQLLLLTTVLENLNNWSDQEIAETYLEILANITLREKTHTFIQTKIDPLIRLVTDQSGFLSESIDLSHLKHRQRDELETTYKFYRQSFDVAVLWDFRCRDLLKLRFDARDNLADWDYHTLTSRAPKLGIVHNKEYVSWRRTGNAYDIRDVIQTFPNHSMATVSILKSNQEKRTKWGYFGDIMSGPFILHGVYTRDDDFYKMNNNKYTKTSFNVAMSNVIKICEHLRMRIGNENIQSWLANNLSITYSTTLDTLKKFKGSFENVFLSCHLAHTLPQALKNIKDNGTMVVENAKMILELNNNHIAAYDEKIISLGNENGMEAVALLDEMDKNHLLMFKKRNLFDK